jgi:2-dehydropantoate 2-reductase
MKPPRENSILIMGIGAMACLFAARLSAANLPVKMFGSWSEGLKALRLNGGVRIVDANGTEKTYPVQVFDQLQDCKGALQSIILVKSWQTPRTASQLAQCLDTNGVALTLQNGLGNFEILAETLGVQRVSWGVTTVGATLLEPGRVIQAGEPVISISKHSSVTALINLLSVAGFKIEREADPTALLWGKLVINAAINPLTAILRISNGDLLSRTATRKLLQAAACEAASVAAGLGIQLPYQDPTIAVETVAYRTDKNLSSMLQDVLRGAPTEIDAICGEIIKAGERVGVPTPILLTLWQLIKSLVPDGI